MSLITERRCLLRISVMEPYVIIVKERVIAAIMKKFNILVHFSLIISPPSI